MKRKTNIPQKTKIRSILQKEIGSVCPFCSNEDVGHFEIHHIDENPTNHEIHNLILLCPTCHSKITKGDILQQDVLDKKISLKNKDSKIQFISVSVDKKRCGWIPIENSKNAFKIAVYKSFFPVFNFSFINQSNKTLLLTNIKVRTKRLPMGMAGPVRHDMPRLNILRPSITYKIKMPLDGEISTVDLEEELEVPTTRAFKFQIELFTEYMEKFRPPYNKYALFFEFGFNNDFYCKIPMILLNSSEYYEKLKHYGLG
ncbi:HNH endonuclease [Flagellimonas algicola]|uniref:HNH endonuclease n=1 Tax=Flagellimonas algicola TaxID=2583815 RepID=A0ABY2WJ72_9FLAO|nr:HNH endonuclease [Allomuricauda algicola]TMU54592.1 HNH endonuclease [Allomuricauda algicola]